MATGLSLNRHTLFSVVGPEVAKSILTHDFNALPLGTFWWCYFLGPEQSPGSPEPQFLTSYRTRIADPEQKCKWQE